MKTIAMDIDGTILNKNNEIDANVLDFFADERVCNSNLIFLTGNSYKIANALMQQLVEKFPKYKDKKYYVGTNNGACIYNMDGELVHSSPMNKKDIKKIVKIIQKKYMPCDVLLSTLDDNIVSLPKNEDRANELKLAKSYQVSKGVMGLNITLLNEKTSKFIKKIGEVYSINILTNNVEEVMADLREFFDDRHLVYYDPRPQIIQVSLSNKWQGLCDILNYEQKINSTSHYEKSAEEVVFIGDGMNDVICMKNCKLSYARGEKLLDEVKNSAKKSLVKLSDALDEIFKVRKKK